MPSSLIGPCSPEPPSPWWLSPHYPARLFIKVIIVIIVISFACGLVLLGYDIQAALLGASAGVLGAAEVARRVLDHP